MTPFFTTLATLASGRDRRESCCSVGGMAARRALPGDPASAGGVNAGGNSNTRTECIVQILDE